MSALKGHILVEGNGKSTSAFESLLSNSSTPDKTGSLKHEHEPPKAKTLQSESIEYLPNALTSSDPYLDRPLFIDPVPPGYYFSPRVPPSPRNPWLWQKYTGTTIENTSTTIENTSTTIENTSATIENTSTTIELNRKQKRFIGTWLDSAEDSTYFSSEDTKALATLVKAPLQLVLDYINTRFIGPIANQAHIGDQRHVHLLEEPHVKHSPRSSSEYSLVEANKHLLPATLQLVENFVKESQSQQYRASRDGRRRVNDRPYRCTFGCGYAARNAYDWRRHEETHEPQELWLCSVCSQNGVENPFIVNRRDKFLQHARNAHKSRDPQKVFEMSKVEFNAKFDPKCPLCPRVHETWNARCRCISSHYEDEMRRKPPDEMRIKSPDEMRRKSSDEMRRKSPDEMLRKPPDQTDQPTGRYRKNEGSDSGYLSDFLGVASISGYCGPFPPVSNWPKQPSQISSPASDNDSDGSALSGLIYIGTPYDDSASILSPIKNRVIQRLFSSFLVSLQGRNESIKSKQQTTKYGESSSDQSTSSPHKTNNKSKKRKRESTSRGNKDQDDNEDEDEDEDEEEKRSRKTKVSCNLASEKLLACPFCKFNPHRYRSCYKYVLKDISRLKQHLSRCHRIPIHCALCSEIFGSEEERDEHLRALTCEKLPPVQWEGINEKQRKQLEQRVSAKTSLEENWYRIFEILFPGQPRPKSPYVGQMLSADLLALQDFFFSEGVTVLREVANNTLPHTLQPQEDEVQAFLETAFQDAVGILLARWETLNNGTSSSPPLSRGPQEDNFRTPSEASSASRRSGQDRSSTERVGDIPTPLTEPDDTQSESQKQWPSDSLDVEGIDWSMFVDTFDGLPDV